MMMCTYHNSIRMLNSDDSDDDNDNSDNGSDSDSDNDGNSECGIPHCDDCSSNSTCNDCDGGFYVSSAGSECVPCEDVHCHECIGGANTCIKCLNGYVSYDYSCVNANAFPRQYLVSQCESYSIDYKCILCDDDCTLETNGKCTCKKSNTAAVASAVISVAVALAIVVFVLLCLKRRKRNKATTTTPAQAVRAQHKDENWADHNSKCKEKDSSNNSCEPQQVIVNHNRGSSSELVYAYGTENENNDIKALCCICNKDSAMYALSCGCCYCVSHVGRFKEFPCEKNKCAKCDNEVVSVTKLGSMCNVCLDMCGSVVRFDCGCQFEVCVKCFHKCIVKEQKCPGCRRSVSNRPVPCVLINK